MSPGANLRQIFCVLVQGFPIKKPPTGTQTAWLVVQSLRLGCMEDISKVMEDCALA